MDLGRQCGLLAVLPGEALLPAQSSESSGQNQWLARSKALYALSLIT